MHSCYCMRFADKLCSKQNKKNHLLSSLLHVKLISCWSFVVHLIDASDQLIAVFSGHAHAQLWLLCIEYTKVIGYSFSQVQAAAAAHHKASTLFISLKTYTLYVYGLFIVIYGGNADITSWRTEFLRKLAFFVSLHSLQIWQLIVQ